MGIFERLRKNTIVNVGRPAPTSPRNQIATLRWANKQKQDDEEARLPSPNVALSFSFSGVSC